MRRRPASSDLASTRRTSGHRNRGFVVEHVTFAQLAALVGVICALAGLAVQGFIFAAWLGGLAARMKILEEQAPVSAKLSELIHALIERVDGVKENVDRLDRTLADMRKSG